MSALRALLGRRIRAAGWSVDPEGLRARARRNGILGVLLVAWCGDTRVGALPRRKLIAFCWYERVRTRRALPAIRSRIERLEDAR